MMSTEKDRLLCANLQEVVAFEADRRVLWQTQWNVADGIELDGIEGDVLRGRVLYTGSPAVAFEMDARTGKVKRKRRSMK